MKPFRFLLFAVLLLGLLRTLPAAEPLPPLELKLDPDVIQPLGLHAEVDLLLVFPEPVTLITGQGLTTGETPGKVQFQQGQENPGIVTLRLLDPKAQVLMQLVVKKQVFVFRLSASENPSTVIRFAWDPRKDRAKQKAREISKEEAKKKSTPVSPERLKQMVNLVGQEPKLRDKLPEAYSNYQSLEVDFWSSKVKGVTLQVHRIARFPDEDTLVFFGSLKNNRDTSYRHSPKLITLKVGAKRTFTKTILFQSRASTPAGESSYVWGTLVGDGNGKPLHLSLKNDFSIQLNP